MPQEIYNEGRVVGLSAWEIFLRNSLGNGVPENEIPDENKWLASMIGSGASMILRVPQGTAAGIKDFPLPQGSNLSAAGLIVANPFIGTCSWDETNTWANKVISYGPLIQNDGDASPSNTDVPPQVDTIADYTDYRNSLAEFLKIPEGIVYTSEANWIARAETNSQPFTGTGEQTTFVLQYDALEIISVYEDETSTTDYTYEEATHSIVFDEAPESGTNIVVTYRYDAPGNPEKDIDPNFNNSSTVVRLYVTATLTNDVLILLTGFTNKRILQSLSGFATETSEGYSFGGSTDIEHNEWADGGMLGPEIIPWASKIVFSVPSSAYSLITSLKRTLPSDIAYEGTDPSYEIDGISIYKVKDSKVRANSIIDFNSIDLDDYYKQHYSSSTLPISVSEVTLGSSDSSNTLVAWYPGMTAAQIQNEASQSEPSNANFFPPALYAAKVTASGPNTLIPLDTAAPGTVKGFTNSTEAYNYKTQMPNNFAIYNNTSTNTFAFVKGGDNNVNNWSSTAVLTYLGSAPTGNAQARLTVGSVSANFVALSDTTGTSYDLTGSSPNVIVKGPAENIAWSDLLQALYEGKKIDVLGTKLHNVGRELQSNNTIGINKLDEGTIDNTLTGVASNKVVVRSGGASPYDIEITADKNGTENDTNLAKFKAGSSVKVGTQFIEFNNGLRLYISSTAPTGPIPDGSIGIGWE
jgi:hypothetical protein